MEDRFIGKRLDGRYEIHELIGSGGMAYVYKAYDKKEERFVAIKILREEFSSNSEFLRRFRNESKAIAMLSHPNIVKVFDVSFGDVVQYIVMEYINEITLKDYITSKGAMPWKTAIFFVIQILKAIEHAHKNGIIHRDMKPQNVLLLQDGTIRITDFGIARFLQSETKTMTDKALGSVHYISPEQAKGEFTSEKVDIYSIGVMMYEMLTGTLPFEAENAVSVAIMQLQAVAKPPRSINPEIPAGLEEITLKAMEKNPAMRFQSAEEMLADIERFRANPSMTFMYHQDVSNTIAIDFVDSPVKDVKSNNQKVWAEPTVLQYDDNYEYEEELIRSKKTAQISMIIKGIVAALIVVLIIVGVVKVMDMIEESQNQEEIIDEVVVPDFTGMNYTDDIEKNTLYDDFDLVVSYVNNDTYEPGYVVRQSPSSGISVKIGSEITLYVVQELTEEEITGEVPDVVGESQTSAYNTILAEGYTPIIVTVNDNNVDTDYVVSTEPSAGESLEYGSEVTIYVSEGSAIVQVIVPNIIGDDLESALLLLDVSGLKYNVTYDENSLLPRDEIVSCDPEPSDVVPEGTTIDVVASAGAKYEREVTVSFSLPNYIDYDVNLKIYVAGILVENSTVDPTQISSYKITYTDYVGEYSVLIRIDGSNYMEGTIVIDYEGESFTVTNTYTIPTPTPYVPPTSDDDDDDDTSSDEDDDADTSSDEDLFE